MKPETHTDSSDTHISPRTGHVQSCPCHVLEGWFPQADLRHLRVRAARLSKPRLLAQLQEKEPELFSIGCPQCVANLTPDIRRASTFSVPRLCNRPRSSAVGSLRHAPPDRERFCGSSTSSTRPASLIRSSASRSLRQPQVRSTTWTASFDTVAWSLSRPRRLHRTPLADPRLSLCRPLDEQHPIVAGRVDSRMGTRSSLPQYWHDPAWLVSSTVPPRTVQDASRMPGA